MIEYFTSTVQIRASDVHMHQTAGDEGGGNEVGNGHLGMGFLAWVHASVFDHGWRMWEKVVLMFAFDHMLEKELLKEGKFPLIHLREKIQAFSFSGDIT